VMAVAYAAWRHTQTPKMALQPQNVSSLIALHPDLMLNGTFYLYRCDVRLLWLIP
jgi:hypothetical protein